MMGGLIRHHDPSVECVLLSRGDHGDVMARRGTVKLDGPWPTREIAVTASLDPLAIAGSDLVLVTVKSQGTAVAIESVAEHLGDAVVVSVQNGFNDDALLRHVAPEKLVMGITATNVSLPEPGTARLQFPGTMVLGTNAGRTNAAATDFAVELLSKTGFPVSQNSNIDGVRYNKLAINSPGYAASLSQTNFVVDGVCDSNWRKYVGIPLAQECIDVFASAGVTLESIPKLPDINRLRKLMGKLNTPVLGPVLARIVRLAMSRKPIQFSLEQDLRRGKPTEVEYTNGEIVRLAARCQRPAPYNQLVIDLAGEVQARGAGKFFTRDEVIERFR